MLVRDWIMDFLHRHRARFGPHDWPAPGSEEFAEFLHGWLNAFSRHSITREEADAASLKLVECPPRYRNDHLPALITSVEITRQVNGHWNRAGRESRAPREYDPDEIAGLRELAEKQGNDLATRSVRELARATLQRLELEPTP